MIKNIIMLCVCVVIVILGIVIKYSPCDTPITYSVGTIDPRFEITKEALIDDTKIAANIWNSTQSKQLLIYDPNSTFTINMVYDARQELTSKINELDHELKEKQGSIDPQIEQFKQDQAAFEKKVQDLNGEIQYWNSQGGAPKEEFDRLVATQSELRSEATELNTRAQSLGQQTTEYNVNARKLNQTIDNYQQVLEYQPEEGLYEQEGGKRKISIFIDVDKEDFLHTLAHEFGHALGLDHLKDKSAIMYYQTTSTLEPTQTEIEQLEEICKRRPMYEVTGQRIRDFVYFVQERIERFQNK